MGRLRWVVLAAESGPHHDVLLLVCSDGASEGCVFILGIPSLRPALIQWPFLDEVCLLIVHHPHRPVICNLHPSR